jgi:hypothetical protein
MLAPPPAHPVITGDDDRRQRLQFRLWQLCMSTLTILAAVWLTTYGALAAILAWVVAKHVLVAILMMGLHRYPRYKDEPEVAEENASTERWSAG